MIFGSTFLKFTHYLIFSKSAYALLAQPLTESKRHYIKGKEIAFPFWSLPSKDKNKSYKEFMNHENSSYLCKVFLR